MNLVDAHGVKGAPWHPLIMGVIRAYIGQTTVSPTLVMVSDHRITPLFAGTMGL